MLPEINCPKWTTLKEAHYNIVCIVLNERWLRGGIVGSNNSLITQPIKLVIGVRKQPISIINTTIHK